MSWNSTLDKSKESEVLKYIKRSHDSQAQAFGLRWCQSMCRRPSCVRKLMTVPGANLPNNLKSFCNNVV